MFRVVTKHREKPDFFRFQTNLSILQIRLIWGETINVALGRILEEEPSELLWLFLSDHLPGIYHHRHFIQFCWNAFTQLGLAVIYENRRSALKFFKAASEVQHGALFCYFYDVYFVEHAHLCRRCDERDLPEDENWGGQNYYRLQN